MLKIRQIADFLERFAPQELAESWDNVGLLVGDMEQSVERVMTCLTITPASVAEAINAKAELIVAHHPLPFHPLARITTDSHEGRLLLPLLSADIAIYSPHTAFDSATDGINSTFAKGLGLKEVRPLVPSETAGAALGAGRWGRLPGEATLASLARQVAKFLKTDKVQLVGDADKTLRTVAIACGSAGEMLESAMARSCDCFITGETSFHTCLAAEASETSLILTGHYASERFAVEWLAQVLSVEFKAISSWASRDEADPLTRI